MRRLFFFGEKDVCLTGCSAKVLIAFCSVIVSSLAFSERLYGQQVVRTTPESVIGYLEYLPEGYDDNSDKYPVVIFLHGIGERGVNTTDIARLHESVQKVTALGPPAYVKNGYSFPFILISPQLKNNYGNWPSSYVMEVIRHVKSYLRIDEKRIYLTGLSLGGGGAWWTAQDFPEFFAALAPVCGGRNTPAMACAIADENLPVWAFHGDKDTIVPLKTSVNMVNAINDCVPSPSPAAKMTIYPGVAHNAWTNAYRTDHAIHDQNIYEWMLSFTNTINRGNVLPRADAGNDRTISGTATEIAGQGRDSDGTITTYAWDQIGGPSPATLSNPKSPKLSASNLKIGAYVFSLKVTDNDGGTDTDYVQLNVKRITDTPKANAGGDITVILPADTVALAGSPDDQENFSYRWVQTSGNECALNGTTSSRLIVSDLSSGEYRFRLFVEDAYGNVSDDEVSVVVTFPPAVDAGPDISLPLTAPGAVLSGSAYDRDGVIKSYSWKKYSGPDVVLTQDTLPVASISGLKEGTYVFILTATDNLNISSSDQVTVTVKKEIMSTDITVDARNGHTEHENTPVREPSHPVAESTQGIFGRLTSLDLENCLVTVFNDAGQRIFSGLWSNETYRSIFSRNGLYLYQIVRNGEWIDTGRIYIRRR